MNRNTGDFLEYESQYLTIDGIKMHYVDTGGSKPTVLFLHGLPANLYLWRNIVPRVSQHARAIAIDMIGFGKSDKPFHIEYNLENYTYFLEAFIKELDLKNIIIVAMDLGLMIGLNYAMSHESNIKGIVMFEGFFQPADEVFKNMSLSSRIIMKIFKNQRIAEKAFVEKGDKSVGDMISMMTRRKLSQDEMQHYQESFADKLVRRKVWMEGIGPNTIYPYSKSAGDIADLINQYSAKLIYSDIPKLLLYANPGATVRKKAVKKARENINKLTVKYIGKGKHFLPEDQPENIAEAIIGFLSE
ncbi:MAG: haloalkane dehalogenase [Halanaerobiales bacterium]